MNEARKFIIDLRFKIMIPGNLDFKPKILIGKVLLSLW